MTLRDIAHRLEAVIARACLALVARLRPETASNLAGGIARAIGPLLPVSRVADDNLRRALPGLDAAARKRVIRGVWDNLGRTAGEFPHVRSLGPTESGPGWEVVGQDIIDAILADGRRLIAVSGHFSNWEVCAAASNVAFARPFGCSIAPHRTRRWMRKSGAGATSAGRRISPRAPEGRARGLPICAPVGRSAC